MGNAICHVIRIIGSCILDKNLGLVFVEPFIQHYTVKIKTQRRQKDEAFTLISSILFIHLQKWFTPWVGFTPTARTGES